MKVAPPSSASSSALSARVRSRLAASGERLVLGLARGGRSVGALGGSSGVRLVAPTGGRARRHPPAWVSGAGACSGAVRDRAVGARRRLARRGARAATVDPIERRAPARTSAPERGARQQHRSCDRQEHDQDRRPRGRARAGSRGGTALRRRRLRGSACGPRSRPVVGSGAGGDAERAGGERQRDGREHADRARTQRPLQAEGGAQQQHDARRPAAPAGANIAGPAEDPAERDRERVAGAAAVPAAVDHEHQVQPAGQQRERRPPPCRARRAAACAARSRERRCADGSSAVRVRRGAACGARSGARLARDAGRRRISGGSLASCATSTPRARNLPAGPYHRLTPQAFR